MVARGFVHWGFTESASPVYGALTVPRDAVRMVITFMRRIRGWYADRQARRTVLRTIEQAVGGR